MANNRRWLLGWALAELASLSGSPSVPAAAAPGAPVLLAPKSRLPYPADADVWVDAQGQPRVTVPGVEPGLIRGVAVLVYRPRGDSLTWGAQLELCARQGLLSAGGRPEFSVNSAPPASEESPDPNANAEETNAFRAADGGYVVLGQIRNLRTRHQLAYVVLLSGKLNGVQAVAQARSVVDELAGTAKLLRLGPPVPPGSTAAGPSLRLEGDRVRQLLQGIELSARSTPRVKAMARAVLPQATAVTLSTWRTAAALSDQAFFAFYLQQAVRLGWGPPIGQDESVPGRPTLLFQRPNGDGVMMVRAQPAPPGTLGPGGATNRLTTTLYVLMMEGKINAASLSPR